MIFHDVKQNTDEWFNIRKGKVTTSNLGIVMANYGKSFSDTAKKYAHKIAYEQVTGEIEDLEKYTNKYIENGHVYEPIAIDEYESETFNMVSNGGFCQSSIYEDVGGSPDGIILLDNGGIEIKSVISWTQFKNIKRNSYDPSYKWQIIGNIWLCGWEYCDFISYGYTCTKKNRLFIHKVEKDDVIDYINMIPCRLEKFIKLIQDIKKYI